MYLGCLCFSLLGLGILDYRYRLALFFDHIRTLKIVAIIVALFIAWDSLGIMLGIFFIGKTKYLTGIRLGHEFPLEELFFLLLLTYVTLLMWRLLEEKWPRI